MWYTLTQLLSFPQVEPEMNSDGTTNAESAARNGIRQVLQAAAGQPHGRVYDFTFCK